MNTPPTISALLDDEQLDRLEILLDTPELEDAMRLDEIQATSARRSPAHSQSTRMIGWSTSWATRMR